METKEMPIVEISKKLKRELDKLDIISDTHVFFTHLVVNGLDEELQDIVNEYEVFEYQSQVVMYLVSTKNYVEKPKPTYYVLFGLISGNYYAWYGSKTVAFKSNVFIAQYDNKKDAMDHANNLNKFMEENK